MDILTISPVVFAGGHSQAPPEFPDQHLVYASPDYPESQIPMPILVEILENFLNRMLLEIC